MTWQFWLQTALSIALALFAFQAKRMIVKYDLALKEKEVLLENDRQRQVADLKKIVDGFREDLAKHAAEMRALKEASNKLLTAQAAALRKMFEDMGRQDQLLRAVAQTVIQKFEKSEVREITNVLLRISKKS